MMRVIHVRACCQTGRYDYIGLFQSSFEAAIDACRRFGICGVRCEVIR